MNHFISQISCAIRQNHPKNHWAVQVAIAFGFIAIAAGYLVSEGIANTQVTHAQVQNVDFSVEGIRVIPHDNPTSAGKLMNVEVDLHFITGGLAAILPSRLLVEGGFLRPASDPPADPPIFIPVGEPFSRTVDVGIQQFDANGNFTAIISDIEILSGYLNIMATIDASGNYAETDEGNNTYVSGLLLVPNYLDVVGPPQINSIDPSNGPIGTHVVLTGTGFGNGTHEYDQVLFGVNQSPPNGLTAGEIISWSDTEIEVIVPDGLSFGPTEVRVLNHLGGGLSDPIGFTVTFPPVSPLSGVYRSRLIPIDAANPELGLQSVGELTAIYGQPTDSSVSFGIKFYKAGGVKLGTLDYYSINIAGSGDPGFDLGAWLASEHGDWLAQIRQIQFVIIMSTENYLDPNQMPWVQSLQLEYTLNAAEVGLINFIGETSKTAAQGAEVNYELEAIPVPNSGSRFVQAKFDVDWNGEAVEGNGDVPPGMTVQFLIDSDNDDVKELMNGSGYIYEFVLDENDPEFKSTGYAFEVKLTSASNTPPDEYAFWVVGSTPNVGIGLRRTAQSGSLTVTGATASDFGLSFIGPFVKSVRPGNSAFYEIQVKSLEGFSTPVTVSTNIITDNKFTSGAITSATFTSNPVFPTTLGNQVTLNIATSSTTAEEGPTIFTITGTAGDLTHTLTTASLEISNEAPEQPAITVVVTAPMETERTTEHPQFIFRLYVSTATGRGTESGRVYQNTSITASEFNAQDEATIEVDEGLVEDGLTYFGYIKSTRHLWAKSTNTFTVDVDLAEQSYDLTFPTLVAGNVGPAPDASEFLEDDQINALDWTAWLMESVGLWDPHYADFNNDGVVNTADINYIVGTSGTNSKWFMIGDLQTQWPL